MICREYLDNFLLFFLHNNLLTINYLFSTMIVNYT